MRIVTTAVLGFVLVVTSCAKTPAVREVPSIGSVDTVQVLIDRNEVPEFFLSDAEAQQLRAAVIRRLESAGLGVWPETENPFVARNYPFQRPTLVVDLGMVPATAYIATLYLRMPIDVRGGEDITATVWTTRQYSYLLQHRDQGPVLDYLEDFLNAWRADREGAA